MAATQNDESAPVTIKKYANRRLYNTSTSSYVTLDHLCDMVREGVDFVVYDAKSSEDITRSVLTQIIVEQEGKGDNLLPISFLRQIIGFYGDNVQRMLLPRYLELSMTQFLDNQDRMQQHMKETMGGIFPFGSLEEMGKQNIAMFEQAMNMFAPLARPAKDAHGEASEAETGSVEALQTKLDDLQRQLDEMAKKSSED
jgi:polyhydroxyalkanoate synthesis repressor PhaR